MSNPTPRGVSVDRRERARRTAFGLGTASVAALAVLVLLLPTALAGAAPNVTTRPPFKNATVVLSNPQSHTGGGTVKLVNSAFFNKTTGVGGFSDNASSTWRSTSMNNSARATGQIVVTLPIKVSTTGTHTISVVWITIATGSVNLTAGLCKGNRTVAVSTCTRSATAFVNGFVFLVDKTAGTSTPNTNVWPGNATSVSNVTTCAFLKCTSNHTAQTSSALHTGKAFWSWDWSGVSLNSSHSYQIKMTLFGGSEVDLMVSTGATLTGAKGNAQLNSATLGMQEDLLSVSIT